VAQQNGNAEVVAEASRGSVMFVDDDHDLRVLVRALLESYGYEVLTATNGRDAIELLMRQENAPDLVLVDLDMPIMDGWDFLRRLRSDTIFASVPVIVQTAADDPPPAGVAPSVTIVRKPVDIAALLEIVRRHCG
jgi:CheY-like chemotaxis protein